MYLQIDDTVELKEPDKFDDFHVVAHNKSQLVSTLADTGTGHLDERQKVWVSKDYLLKAAKSWVRDASWMTEFNNMVIYARNKGWLSSDGGKIQAHIKWVDTDEVKTKSTPSSALKEPVTLPPKGYRVGIVGVGLQGSGIAKLLLDSPHSLVGAVDRGDLVGKRISELLDTPHDKEADIVSSIEELISLKPEVVILSAAVSQEMVLNQAEVLLDHGINVVTIHQDLFEAREAWATTLDERATTGGASILATGVQDTWWVHVPSIVAGSSWSVEEVIVTSCVDVNTLSETVAFDYVGVDRSTKEFADFSISLYETPAIQGAPLREAARRMGLTTTGEQRNITPIFAETSVDWQPAGKTIASGRTIGTEERTSFETDRGIRFTGILRTVILGEGEQAYDAIDIKGDIPLHLEIKPFPGEDITNAAAVNRLVDVVEAPSGVLTASMLPPARYLP